MYICVCMNCRCIIDRNRGTIFATVTRKLENRLEKNMSVMRMTKQILPLRGKSRLQDSEIKIMISFGLEFVAYLR